MKRQFISALSVVLLTLSAMSVWAQQPATAPPPAAAKPGQPGQRPKPKVLEHHFLDSNGVKIHYTVQGKGQPVLLIHGFGVNMMVQWDLPGVTKALIPNYQVISMDNRGHGRSGKPEELEKYGMEMVEDAVRLLDHLKIQKASVIGYSLGGFITNKLLVTHPDRIQCAVLGGAGWGRPDDVEGQKLMDSIADSLEQGKGLGPLIDRLTPADATKRTAEQVEEANKMLLSFNPNPKVLAAVMRGAKQFGVTEDQLKANKIPVLALIGSKDPIKDQVDPMVGKMPNFKAIVIDGGDHMSTPGKAEFIKAIQAFLAENSGGPKPAEPAPVAGK